MTTPAIPDAQECKRRSIRTLAKFEDISSDAQGAHVALALLGQVAQVWATLATVPEPLEEVYGQVLESTPTLGANFPTLTCPHGFQAQLVPVRIEEIDGTTFPTNLRYVFNDCETCP